MAKCKNCKHLKIDSSIEKKICFLIGEIGNPDEEISCCCYRPATNADRIRCMADKELAGILFASCYESMGFESCPHYYEDGYTFGTVKKSCSECILEWLKSEVGCE